MVIIHSLSVSDLSPRKSSTSIAKRINNKTTMPSSPPTTLLVESSDNIYEFSMIPKPLKAQLKSDELELLENGVVCWTANSQMHPRKWTLKRKIYDTAVIVFLEFFTTFISNTGSASARDSHEALGISYEWAVFSFTTT
jgi:hypothetical protein